MSVSDEEIRRKVAQWLAYGDEDLRLARHGLTLLSECPYRLIAYHAQQCAEKHLTAASVVCKAPDDCDRQASRRPRMASVVALLGTG